MAGLEISISAGGTNQECTTLACYNEKCFNPDPLDLDWVQPAWCADFMIGKTWSEDPYYFNTVDFGDKVDPIPVGGFKIGMRYWVSQMITPGTIDPISQLPGPSTITRTYGNWTVISQTIEVSVSGSPTDRGIFQTTPNSNWVQLIPPGDYEGEDIGALSPYQYCGIKDGAEYQYGGIFNEGNISYIPRLCPAQQMPVKGSPPSSPYDTGEGVYPINTLCGYSPDPRPALSVGYKITTVWKPEDGDEVTSVINVSQTVTQDTSDTDYSDEIEEALNRAYYTYDDYQVYLWPVDEPPLYEEDGTPIPPVPRYNARTDSYYDQEKNGEGFKPLDKDEPL